MRVIVPRDAFEDVERTDAWWRENRPDAPDVVRADVAAAIDDLPRLASALPVFRRLRGAALRRLHLPRVHRHVYFVVADDEQIVVIAVWGAVRAVLPALRARIDRSGSGE